MKKKYDSRNTCYEKKSTVKCNNTTWYCAVSVNNGIKARTYDLEEAQKALGRSNSGNPGCIIPMTHGEGGKPGDLRKRGWRDPHQIPKTWAGGAMWWNGWGHINQCRDKCAQATPPTDACTDCPQEGCPPLMEGKTKTKIKQNTRKWATPHSSTIKYLPKNYNVEFDIKPLGTRGAWSNILHLTNDGHNSGTYGRRIPGIWFWPNTRKLHIRVGQKSNGNAGCDPSTQLTHRQWTKVRLEVRDRSTSVFFDDENGRNYMTKKCNVGANQRKAFKNVQVWSGDPWYTAPNAEMRNLKISDGTAWSSVVNCATSGWGGWSGCNTTTGKKSRTRTVTRAAENGGTPCGSLKEEKNCPVNCALSGWSGWSGCSKDCGGGTQTRTRTVTRAAKNGGTCGSLKEERDCNTQACFGYTNTFAGELQTPERSECQTCTTSNDCGSGLSCYTRPEYNYPKVNTKAMFGQQRGDPLHPLVLRDEKRSVIKYDQDKQNTKDEFLRICKRKCDDDPRCLSIGFRWSDDPKHRSCWMQDIGGWPTYNIYDEDAIKASNFRTNPFYSIYHKENTSGVVGNAIRLGMSRIPGCFGEAKHRQGYCVKTKLDVVPETKLKQEPYKFIRGNAHEHMQRIRGEEGAEEGAKKDALRDVCRKKCHETLGCTGFNLVTGDRNSGFSAIHLKKRCDRGDSKNVGYYEKNGGESKESCRKVCRAKNKRAAVHGSQPKCNYMSYTPGKCYLSENCPRLVLDPNAVVEIPTTGCDFKNVEVDKEKGFTHSSGFSAWSTRGNVLGKPAEESNCYGYDKADDDGHCYPLDVQFCGYKGRTIANFDVNNPVKVEKDCHWPCKWKNSECVHMAEGKPPLYRPEYRLKGDNEGKFETVHLKGCDLSKKGRGSSNVGYLECFQKASNECTKKTWCKSFEMKHGQAKGRGVEVRFYNINREDTGGLTGKGAQWTYGERKRITQADPLIGVITEINRLRPACGQGCKDDNDCRFGLKCKAGSDQITQDRCSGANRSSKYCVPDHSTNAVVTPEQHLHRPPILLWRLPPKAPTALVTWDDVGNFIKDVGGKTFKRFEAIGKGLKNGFERGDFTGVEQVLDLWPNAFSTAKNMIACAQAGDMSCAVGKLLNVKNVNPEAFKKNAWKAFGDMVVGTADHNLEQVGLDGVMKNGGPLKQGARLLDLMYGALGHKLGLEHFAPSMEPVNLLDKTRKLFGAKTPCSRCLAFTDLTVGTALGKEGVTGKGKGVCKALKKQANVACIAKAAALGAVTGMAGGAIAKGVCQIMFGAVNLFGRVCEQLVYAGVGDLSSALQQGICKRSPIEFMTCAKELAMSRAKSNCFWTDMSDKQGQGAKIGNTIKNDAGLPPADFRRRCQNACCKEKDCVGVDIRWTKGGPILSDGFKGNNLLRNTGDVLFNQAILKKFDPDSLPPAADQQCILRRAHGSGAHNNMKAFDYVDTQLKNSEGWQHYRKNNVKLEAGKSHQKCNFIPETDTKLSADAKLSEVTHATNGVNLCESDCCKNPECKSFAIRDGTCEFYKEDTGSANKSQIKLAEGWTLFKKEGPLIPICTPGCLVDADCGGGGLTCKSPVNGKLDGCNGVASSTAKYCVPKGKSLNDDHIITYPRNSGTNWTVHKNSACAVPSTHDVLPYKPSLVGYKMSALSEPTRANAMAHCQSRGRTLATESDLRAHAPTGFSLGKVATNVHRRILVAPPPMAQWRTVRDASASRFPGNAGKFRHGGYCGKRMVKDKVSLKFVPFEDELNTFKTASSQKKCREMCDAHNHCHFISWSRRSQNNCHLAESCEGIKHHEDFAVIQKAPPKTVFVNSHKDHFGEIVEAEENENGNPTDPKDEEGNTIDAKVFFCRTGTTDPSAKDCVDACNANPDCNYATHTAGPITTTPDGKRVRRSACQLSRSCAPTLGKVGMRGTADGTADGASRACASVHDTSQLFALNLSERGTHGRPQDFDQNKYTTTSQSGRSVYSYEGRGLCSSPINIGSWLGLGTVIGLRRSRSAAVRAMEMKYEKCAIDGANDINWDGSKRSKSEKQPSKSNVSAADCVQKCAAILSCKSVDFKPSGGKCWLSTKGVRDNVNFSCRNDSPYVHYEIEPGTNTGPVYYQKNTTCVGSEKCDEDTRMTPAGARTLFEREHNDATVTYAKKDTAANTKGWRLHSGGEFGARARCKGTNLVDKESGAHESPEACQKAAETRGNFMSYGNNVCYLTEDCDGVVADPDIKNIWVKATW